MISVVASRTASHLVVLPLATELLDELVSGIAAWSPRADLAVD